MKRSSVYRGGALAFLLFVMVLTGLYFASDEESRILDKAARKEAPGDFVSLTDGFVHYEAVGPTNGQSVILLHGITIPSYIWDPTFIPLAEAGFRVVRYDRYGTGYSDRPDVDYNNDLFHRQLNELMSSLDLTLPVSLVGISAGGGLAVSYTAAHTERVGKLVLIDPFVSAEGVRGLWGTVARLTAVPYLGEFLFNVVEVPLSVRLDARFREQAQFRGFRRAMLSARRNSPMQLLDIYKHVGRSELPVLLFWGREDEVLPFEQHEQVMEAIPQVEFVAVEGAGHIAHADRPDVVNPAIIEFLSR